MWFVFGFVLLGGFASLANDSASASFMNSSANSPSNSSFLMGGFNYTEPKEGEIEAGFEKLAEQMKSKAAKKFAADNSPLITQVSPDGKGFQVVCPLMPGLSTTANNLSDCNQMRRDAGLDPYAERPSQTRSPADRKPQQPRTQPAEKGSGSGKNDGKEKDDGKYKANDFAAGSIPANLGAAKSATPPGTCDYSPGTPLRQEFSNLQRECAANLGPAVAACSPERQKGIQQALDEAKNMMRQISQSVGKSMLAACDRFGKATTKIKDALKDYKESCEPAKAKCENSCLKTTRTGAEIAEGLKNNEACFRIAIASVDDIKKVASETSGKFDRCKAFDQPLEQAHADVQQLVQAFERSASCEKQSTETCRLDPVTGDCASPELSQVAALGGSGGLSRGTAAAQGSEQDEEETSGLETPEPDEFETFGTAGVNGPNGASGESSRRFGEEEANGPNGAAGTAGGKKGPRMGVTGDQFESSGRRRKKRKSYSFGLVPKKRGLKKEVPKNSNLAKFLPGGKADPNRANRDGFVDGITSANGPSIFEKVSRRYQVHEPRLIKKSLGGVDILGN